MRQIREILEKTIISYFVQLYFLSQNELMRDNNSSIIIVYTNFIPYFDK